MKKPTLIDVGNLAGVSAITVSRAIRQPELLSDSMRTKVQEAIETLGYVPDVAASALASNRSNVIGMLVPSLSNAVFTAVLAGAYEAINGTKYTIQIGNVHYSALSEQKLLPSFLSLKPAGLIVAGIDQTETVRKQLQAVPCPVVQIMDIATDPIDTIVGFSHLNAAKTAVEHMIGQGFKKIGFLGARMDPRSQKRLAGYRSALAKSNLQIERLEMTTSHSSSVEVGRHLLSDLLSQAPDCDAVFCNNDDIATGAVFECHARGIKVPEQMGICGFNDLGTTSQMHPAVTSVYTPRFEIGKKAAEIVVQRLDTVEEDAEKIFDLGYDLKIRASTMRT